MITRRGNWAILARRHATPAGAAEAPGAGDRLAPVFWGSRNGARGRVGAVVAGAAVATGIATWAVLARRPVLAGSLALVAGVLLTTSGALVGRRGGLDRLLDAFADRTFDGCVLGAVAWVARTDNRSVATAALVALGASFLASYVRARGASLGYDVEEGVGARAVRCALVGLALLLGASDWAIWTLAVFMTVVAAVRSSQVPKEERLATEP